MANKGLHKWPMVLTGIAIGAIVGIVLSIMLSDRISDMGYYKICDPPPSPLFDNAWHRIVESKTSIVGDYKIIRKEASITVGQSKSNEKISKIYQYYDKYLSSNGWTKEDYYVDRLFFPEIDFLDENEYYAYVRDEGPWPSIADGLIYISIYPISDDSFVFVIVSVSPSLSTRWTIMES